MMGNADCGGPSEKYAAAVQVHKRIPEYLGGICVLIARGVQAQRIARLMISVLCVMEAKNTGIPQPI